MKYYVQFKAHDLKNNLVDAMGTDAVFKLDGRNTLDNMTMAAHSQAHELRHVRKDIIGFVIHKGDLRQSVPIPSTFKKWG